MTNYTPNVEEFRSWIGEMSATVSRDPDVVEENMRQLDRLIAKEKADAIRDHLLSDEAVERAAWGIHAFHDRGDWEHEPAEVLDEYLNMALAALMAAIEGDE